MRQKLAELSPLMMASFLVQTSNAAITTMIAIVIAQRGGEQSDVSLIAACYALGFMLGCFVAPAQVFRVGLIRAYAGAAAVVTMSIVGLDLLEGTGLWAFLRFMMGASIAAVFAISDAWMNGNTPSDLRGRVIAIYSIAMGVGSLVSQMIFLLADAEMDDFVLMFAVVMNFSVVLVSFTSSSPPTLESPLKKRSRMLTITSKTASIAAFVAGFSVVSIISILPFYLTKHKVEGELVAMSLAFDRAEGRSMIDISTSLLVIYSLGSIAGPFTVMTISEITGNVALPYCVLVACALIIGTGFFRRVSIDKPTEHIPSAGVILKIALKWPRRLPPWPKSKRMISLFVSGRRGCLCDVAIRTLNLGGRL